MNSISPQMLGLLGREVTLVKGPGEGDPAHGQATLKRLLRIGLRRRRLLIGAILAGAAIGGAVTLATPRQYASTVRLQVSRESAQVVNVGSISRDVSIGDQEFYQTQYGLLRAQTLAERVARDLGVVDDPAFFAMFGRKVAFAGHPGAAGRAARNAIAGEILLAHIEVAPVHGSSLVDVQAKSRSPELSQRIAQTWGRDFIASNLERRLGQSSYARQFLESRLDQLRDRLEASERRAMEYAAREGIIDLPQTGGNARSTRGDLVQGRSLVSDDLIALNTERDAATAERIKASSQLASFVSHPDATGDALGYRAIGLLRKERADAAGDYAKLAAQAPSDSVQAKAGRAQLDALDAAIKSEEDRLRASLQQTYQAALAREQALTQRVNALKAQLSDLRQRSIQYNIYQRDADTNRELYDGLLQRYKEIGVAGAAENNNVAVVDAARLPETPSSPRLSVNLLLFTLAGAILGLIVVAVLEQLGEGAEPALSPNAPTGPPQTA
jgi:uncharacterized protein involved in exopolysaccharide biosynthesis